MAHTYSQFEVETVNGVPVSIPATEILRIMGSGVFRDGSAWEGLKLAGTITIGEANPTPRATAAGNTSVPAANTAAVVTKAAAGAGVYNVIGGVYWSYDDDPTGGSLIITDDGTAIFTEYITSKGPGFFPFDPPLQNAVANKALVATLAAGGGTVKGTLNLNAWTK
jgi:hypothetical protein